jgi:hypothetical protein
MRFLRQVIHTNTPRAEHVFGEDVEEVWRLGDLQRLAYGRPHARGTGELRPREQRGASGSAGAQKTRN